MAKLSKREYRRFHDYHSQRVLKELKEAFKEVKRDIENGETRQHVFDEMLALLMLLVFNYTIWMELGLAKTRMMLQLYGLTVEDAKLLARIMEYVRKDEKVLIKILGKRNYSRLAEDGVAEYVVPFTPLLRSYFTQLEAKIYDDMTRYYNELKLRQLANPELTDEMISEKLENELARRAELIAVTETTRMYTLGTLRSAYTQGVGGFRYQAVVDDRTCQICLESNGRYVRADDIATLSFYAPPRHPNCRCRLIPVKYIPPNARMLRDLTVTVTNRPVDRALILEAVRW